MDVWKQCTRAHTGLSDVINTVWRCVCFKIKLVTKCEFISVCLQCFDIVGWGYGGALVSSDGVAPSRMVGVSASVNLPLHDKVQKFSSCTGSPGWSRKKGRKTVVVVV